MNDSQFTPALLVFGIVLGGVLAYVEMLWLRRPLHMAADWRGLLLVTFVNAAFLFLVIAAVNSYLFLFVFPIPVIPAVYVAVKLLTYALVGRWGAGPVHAPWKLALLSVFVHGAVGFAAVAGFASINPTRSNLEKAIRERKNGLLDLMLWTSVKTEPNMSVLVNEAITNGNDDAVRRLIRRGADPRQTYWMGQASPEILWRITKWRLENGVKAEEIGDLSEHRDIGYVAVSYGLDELKYCLSKGLDPAKSTRILQDALQNQPLQSRDSITPEEQRVMREKIALLIDRGAEVNAPGDMQFTPIFNLILLNEKLNLSSVLELLLDKGAEVNGKSPNPVYPPDRAPLPKGMTPLMMAVALKRTQYVELLLKHGADPGIRDSEGHAAIDYAIENNAGAELQRLLSGK